MSPGVPWWPLTITAITPNPGSSVVSCTLIGNPTQSRQGGTSASASSGSGGWQVTDRTRQKASTEWLDYYPIVMTLTCRIDAGVGPDAVLASVEPAVAVLESFEEPVSGSVPPLPPLLTISGPIQHTNLIWVCSRLEITGGDDGALRNFWGQRTMQLFTLELTEYSPSTAIVNQQTPAQAAAIQGGTASGQTTLTSSGQTYTVVAGDTLQSLAARFLGSVSDWTQIALLNGLANGAILTPGQQLQIPAA